MRMAVRARVKSAGRELLRRAAYGINAVRRVAGKVAAGEPVADALARERPNFEAHQAAGKQRVQADRDLEAARRKHGPVLGWYLGPNENHCEICPPLAGNNFHADRPPAVGPPGGVHPNCKCRAGAKHPAGRMIGGKAA